MAYQQAISREFKALFIFLLDQSMSMEEPLAGGERKCDELATAVNAWLQNMVIACSKAEGFKDYFDIVILGYGTDEDAVPVIGPALVGPLDGREMVSISDIANNPARMEQVTVMMPDDETGELLSMEQQRPVWVEARVAGGTPICSAIVKACEIIDRWTAEHGNSYPPIVINITDGESTEADPIPYAETLRERCTNDGNVLFFNLHLSSTPADSFMFRGNGELMPDQFAKQLFEMSSPLPESMVKIAQARGMEVEPNARGMAYNASMVDLINFLDMGTRVVDPKSLR